MTERQTQEVGVFEAIGRARGAESTPMADDGATSVRPALIRHSVTQAFGVWLGTRLALILITIGAYVFHEAPSAPTVWSVFSANPDFSHYVLPYISGSSIWANWVHWDASWYLLIALRGYDIFTPASAGFFPLYPLTIHLLTLVVGRQALLPIALILSNLAALLAFIGLGLLAVHEEKAHAQGRQPPETLDDATLARASGRLMAMTAAYPYAFFLFAPFTEGFFLALLVYCFLCARRGQWRWAILLAML